MKYKCQEMVLDSTLGSGRAQKCYKGQRKSGKERNEKLRENIYSDIERHELHNKELHNLYSSPNIIRMIKSRRMRWAGHVTRKGGRGIHIGYWWESQKERDH
jgi:hypothetical protein